ncbi:MAG: adenylosuccinate lyase, partial [Candidatus Nanopelagicales bacterium]
ALDLRKGLASNDLFDRLAQDTRLRLSRDEIAALVSSPIEFTGAARAQVSAVASRVAGLAAAYPEAAAYSPGAIL